ncbi:Uncharacterized protein dnm_069370 [Desulfonema magnum]|uniref:Uncharacterized protein n=1 Tax=Desulfonema magnum TaxID=45655 RepID=A0A975BSN2_9BACT|nr:Uncharacterized protein dnm_069370 [Desulfonema magnum]
MGVLAGRTFLVPWGRLKTARQFIAGERENSLAAHCRGRNTI